MQLFQTGGISSLLLQPSDPRISADAALGDMTFAELMTREIAGEKARLTIEAPALREQMAGSETASMSPDDSGEQVEEKIAPTSVGTPEPELDRTAARSGRTQEEASAPAAADQQNPGHNHAGEKSDQDVAQDVLPQQDAPSQKALGKSPMSALVEGLSIQFYEQAPAPIVTLQRSGRPEIVRPNSEFLPMASAQPMQSAQKDTSEATQNLTAGRPHEQGDDLAQSPTPLTQPIRPSKAASDRAMEGTSAEVPYPPEIADVPLAQVSPDPIPEKKPEANVAEDTPLSDTLQKPTFAPEPERPPQAEPLTSTELAAPGVVRQTHPTAKASEPAADFKPALQTQADEGAAHRVAPETEIAHVKPIEKLAKQAAQADAKPVFADRHSRRFSAPNQGMDRPLEPQRPHAHKTSDHAPTGWQTRERTSALNFGKEAEPPARTSGVPIHFAPEKTKLDTAPVQASPGTPSTSWQPIASTPGHILTEPVRPANSSSPVDASKIETAVHNPATEHQPDEAMRKTAEPSNTVFGAPRAPKDGQSVWPPMSHQPVNQTTPIVRDDQVAVNVSPVRTAAREDTQPLQAARTDDQVTPREASIQPTSPQVPLLPLTETSQSKTLVGDPLAQPEEFSWDVRPLSHTGQASAPPQIQKAEPPPPLAHAIAEALRKAPEKPIEIALNPVELGRVRMVMSTNETGLNVTITADRGETLDLMRRNIDDLGKSLSDLGFEDVSFTFDGGQRGSNDPQATSQDEDGTEGTNTSDRPVQRTTTTPQPQAGIGTQTGIDMRL